MNSNNLEKFGIGTEIVEEGAEIIAKDGAETAAKEGVEVVGKEAGELSFKRR